MKKKACKQCKVFYDGDQCPLCRSGQSVTNWKGRIAILDAEKSSIAQKIGIAKSAEYAIKVT